MNALAKLASLGHPFYYRIMVTPQSIELKVSYCHKGSTQPAEDNYAVSNTEAARERLTKAVTKIVNSHK
ncbi:hypothetical protein MA9V1_105 [Chryseobacterium phage MA9V-1]|nr:hypothetical protein MA9V1_105 [Chryseobacterium phage MA9V-1]